MARALIVTVLALGALVVGSAGAQASCVAPLSIRDQVASAGSVFIGTVIFTSDNDRVARVRVESIWRGPELPAYVEVHGSPVTGPGASSIDRKYIAGLRYLFVLYSANQPLQDNSCSGTQVFTTELAALAPAGARSPAPSTAGDEIQNALGQYWLPALGLLALVAGAVFIGLRRVGKP
jgi:hypothetical protein